MNMVQIIVMIVAGIVAFVAMNKQKQGAAWGQPVAIICAIIAIVAALWSTVSNLSGSGAKKAQEREVEFQKIQTRKLGQYIAQNHAGAKVIIINDPFNDGTRPNPMLEGLKDGLGSAVTIVAEVAPAVPKMENAEGPEGEMMEPMETWYTARAMDDILKGANADYDMVITCIGLPAGGLARLKGKKVAIAGGSVYEYGPAIQGKMIVAAVTYKPDAEYDDKPVPSNMEEAFNKRYLLVTPENLAEVATKYGELFKKR
ncbi:MAG: hypothetical protein GX937_03330 [Lentisphaerae bacterium]|mgnify:CR=1 FL=1|nr:hypothetical protein [Lentisphaerota bacterium]